MIPAGEQFELPEDQGATLLCKVPMKVRRVDNRERERTPWLSAFREIAAAVEGITGDDLRFHPLLHIIDACEQALRDNDWMQFEQHAAVTRQVVRLTFGAPVRWESNEGVQQGCLEDLVIDDDDGHLWVAVPSGWVRFDRLTTIGQG